MEPFRPDELQGGDSRKDARVLVAVAGKVYDVSGSRLWKNGRHMNRHHAGRDLTSEIAAAPHGPEVLERVELVGELTTADAAAELGPSAETPPLIAAVLARHPHPMTVHFPIALSITAALFTFLALVTGSRLLATAAFYNQCVAVLAAPAAIAMGLLSWRYNYGQTMTPLFRNKLILSAALMVLLVCVLLLRVLAPSASASGGSLFGLHTAVALLLAPTVMALGYHGGKITFPD